MLIYLGLYLLLMIVWAVYYLGRKTKQTKWIAVGFSWASMVCLFALRHASMGIDLQYGTDAGYLGAYKAFGDWSWGELLMQDYQNYEKGYMVFNKLLTYISKHEQMLLIGVAVLTVTLLFIVLVRYSDDIFISLVVFVGTPCFCAMFSSLRQIIAVMICLLSLLFVFKKKPIPFIITVLVAFFFHKTAIIFLIAYPLYRIRVTKLWRFISAILLGVIFVLKKPLFSLARLIKPDAEMTETGAYMLFLIFCFIYIVCCIFGDHEDRHFGGLMNIFWVACTIMAFSGLFNTAERLAWYFIISLVLIMPLLISRQKQISLLNGQIFYWGILLCFLGSGMYQIYSTSWAMAYPYYFAWETVWR